MKKRLVEWWRRCGFFVVSVGPVDNFGISRDYLMVRLRSWVIGGQICLNIGLNRMGVRANNFYRARKTEPPPYLLDIYITASGVDPITYRIVRIYPR